MVSISEFEGKPSIKLMFLEGLSSDDKPTKIFEGHVIRNGSTFYEMDTKKAYKYDEENEQWLAQ